MILVAQIETVPAEALKNFVLIVAGIAALAYYIKEIFSGKKKREVSFEFTPADKEEFQAHIEWDRREHENLFKKISGVERGAADRLDQRLSEMQRSAEEGREKLHKRINTISVGVARLCGRAGLPLPKEEDEL